MNEQKMCLRDTIIPKSDQLNYDDVADKPLAVRVTGLAAGSQEQPVIVRVAAMDGAALRDYKPCKSMRRVLIACWGDRGKDWIGKSMTLVGDPSVVFGGVRVGGIRVAAVSGIDAPRKIMLTTTRSKRAEYVVEAMKDNLAVDPDYATKEAGV
jgi:hypothetical protein